MIGGVSVSVRTPGASVAFQANVPYDGDTARSLKKTLTSEQAYSWPIGPFARSEIVLLAIQSQYEIDVTINGETTTIYGSAEKDFGLLYADSGDNSFGALPFASGDVTEITVENKTTKLNQVVIIIASAIPDEGSQSGSV